MKPWAILVTLSWISAAMVAQGADWQQVDTIFGRKGAVQDGLYKVTFPRTDLTVKVGNITLEPGLALTSWIGFAAMRKNAMMMGDLVLLENEVVPVMTKLVAEGMQVTAC